MVTSSVSKKGVGSSVMKWRLGDRVRFRFGLSTVTGKITDFVGPIAPGRKMVYRVEFSMGGQEPLTTSLTADEFKPVR